VALKALMAISGLIMYGYLILHMGGNLWVLAGQQAFDTYAHHLRILGEPMLPHSSVLWIVRIVLLAGVIAHIWSAVVLSRRSHEARGGIGKRYHSNYNRRGMQRSYASFTLRWGGAVIALFVIYHLLHLTWNVIAPGGASDSPYQRYVNGFGVWWVLLSYVIALIAVGFHLRHGLWSGLTTLGANTGAGVRRGLNVVATAVALVITIGFLTPPILIFLGVVG
jgi:succinate dehydrogenase / fumarate reductase cytochrome b subunit